MILLGTLTSSSGCQRGGWRATRLSLRFPFHKPNHNTGQVHHCSRSQMLQVRFGQAYIAGTAQAKRADSLRDTPLHSCLSLVAALVSARFSAVVLFEYPPSPALPLSHTPHTPASASIPQTASASCTAWTAASLVSVSSTVSNVPSLANREQAATSTRLNATPTPPTTRPGSRSARSFVSPSHFRMTLHHLPIPVNYLQRDRTLPLLLSGHLGTSDTAGLCRKTTAPIRSGSMSQFPHRADAAARFHAICAVQDGAHDLLRRARLVTQQARVAGPPDVARRHWH
jgi:hypothetical protein